MILPIIAYGDPVLKQIGVEIDKNYPKLKELIDNMFDTMYKASGVGLAAPQVGLSIRLFIIDASPFAEDGENEELKDFVRVFINARIIEETGEEWSFNEGCLSIPGVREDVSRKPKLKIQYYDENFKFHEEYFEGLSARIIQHEYDHIDGKLFTDRINPLRRRMIKNKLTNISMGIAKADYKMKFPSKKNKTIDN